MFLHRQDLPLSLCKLIKNVKCCSALNNAKFAISKDLLYNNIK